MAENVSLKELAGKVQAQHPGVAKNVIETLIKIAFEEIKAEVEGGKDVRIHGFGTFVLQERSARTGRNPATGESIEIPASASIKFKPTKSAKK